MLWVRGLSGAPMQGALWRAARGAGSLVIEECVGGNLAIFLSGVEERVALFHSEVGIRQGLFRGSTSLCRGVEISHERFADGA